MCFMRGLGAKFDERVERGKEEKDKGRDLFL